MNAPSTSQVNVRPTSFCTSAGDAHLNWAHRLLLGATSGRRDARPCERSCRRHTRQIQVNLSRRSAFKMLLPLCLSALLATASLAAPPSADTASRVLPSPEVPVPVAANRRAPAETTALLAANSADATAPGTTSSCGALPPLPARPARVRRVTDFGVTPSDSVDNTDAIQRALNGLAPGEWLVFPPGRYLHSKTLHVKVPNTVLWGEGATLHATNPADEAVLLEADGASIYKFTL